MNEGMQIGLFGVIVFCTHCLEGITGFGCTVLALPFAVLLLGLKTAVPVLVVLAWILAGYIVWRSRKAIVWRHYLVIVLYASIGLPLGILLYDFLPKKGLKLFLSVFMIGVGVRGFVSAFRAADQSAADRPSNAGSPFSPSFRMRGVLALGGVVHGAFGTGGPFVVIYASKALQDKTLFRVTLCLLWLTLNTLLMIKWTVAGGIWTRAVMVQLAASIPFLFGGMMLGDYLHHRVGERFFKLLVYAVLAGSGGAMLYSAGV